MRSVRSLAVRAAAALGLATMAAATGVVGASAAHAADSQVYVVHGIPKTPVDVYVNGKKQLDNFEPGKVAGPLSLAAGSYDIKVTAANAVNASSPIIELKAAAVPADANISIVAHLDAAGKPVLTPFVNDVSPVAAGKARIVVRHTAAAPAVDVRAGGTVVFPNLTNPNQAKADIGAATVKADVVLKGTSTVAIGPADLTLAAGTETIVYAVGSATDKTLGLVTQTLTGLGSAPAGVGAGTGGLLDESLPIWAVASLAGGAMLLLASGTRLARKSGR